MKPHHASKASKKGSKSNDAKPRDISPGSPLVKDLMLFFELRDKNYLPIVEELFRLYEFADIAKGIHRKYRLLPVGWKVELTRLRQKKDPKLNWLNLSEVEWLTETTDSYPSTNKYSEFGGSDEDEPEQVVAEFITNERAYFEKLQAFMTAYVSEVEAIAENKIGPYAQQALGLDRQQVKYIFGGTLLDVYKAVEKFMVLLETLTMVPAKPIIPGGRPAHLADIISQSGPTLVKSYAPYNAAYQAAKKVLEAQTAKLNSLQPAQVNEGALRHLNFNELWTEISQSRAPIKNLGIDSVMILPIRRFPNYKLFFVRIQKSLDKNSPAYAKVMKALDDVEKFTRLIDNAVKDTSMNETSFLTDFTD